MKKLMVFLMALGLVIGGSGLAQALTWQTAPVLGTSTYDTGDVIVVTASGLVNIPHTGIIYNPWSMNFFYVGQTVDAGSGIYYDGADGSSTYHWSVTYTGPGSPVTWQSDYLADGGGFVMNYLDPMPTLTIADVGVWTYTETWANITSGNSEKPLSYSTNFTVGVPEPGTLLLLGSGLLGLVAVGRKKFRK